MTNMINKTGCIYDCSYDETRGKKSRAEEETEFFDPFDSLGYFEEFDSKIEFYGKKANKTKAEYDAMADEEKLEYILLQYKPICLKAAKKYSYDGAEFQDMYMQACVEILEVIDKYGLDDEDLSYHILSRVGINVKRSAEKASQGFGDISFDDEKTEGSTELFLVDLDLERKESELFDELGSYLSGQELEMAIVLSRYGSCSCDVLAEKFGISRRTTARKLAAIREKLAPLRAELRTA